MFEQRWTERINTELQTKGNHHKTQGLQTQNQKVTTSLQNHHEYLPGLAQHSPTLCQGKAIVHGILYTYSL